MSRVLKGVGIAVGVVVAAVAVAATGGAAVGAFLANTGIGGFFSSAGAIGSAVGLTGAAAVFGGAAIIGGGLGALSYLTPSAPDTAATGAAAALGGATNPDPDDYYVFGECFFPMQRVYLETHGSDDQSLLMIYHHASHEVQSIDEVYHNAELLVSRSGGNWEDYPDGSLRILHQLGATNPAVSMSFATAQWDSAGFGLTATGFQFTQNEDKPDLISTNSRVYGRGAKVYDPRQDSTRGGFGGQRADDPTTWNYSTADPTPGSNLALIVLRYILGETQNGTLRWGVGANPDNIDYAGFIAAANLCDELVGGKPRHHIGGSINCSAPAEDALRTLMGHCGGWAGRNAAGLWTIYIPHNDLAAPDWTITAQDCVQPISISDQPLSEQINTMQGRCAPKNGLGQLVAYPVVKEAALVTQDGGEYSASVDFPFTADFERAQYQARQRIRRARFDRRYETVLSWAYFRIQKNDTVEVNAPEFGLLNEVMRVVARTIVPDGGIAVVLGEESTSIYDQTEPVSPNPTIAQILRFDPATKIAVTSLSAGAWNITGQDGGGLDGFSVSFSVSNRFIERTELQYRKTGDADWIPWPSLERSLGLITVPGLPSLTPFDVRVRHISTFGVPGDWASTTVTTGGNASLNFDRITGANKPEDGATRNVNRGAWASGTEYKLGDIVFDEATASSYQYVNSTPSTGNAVTNGTYWQVLASGGGGSPGAPGASAQIQYGPSASGPWDEAFDAGDTHLRTRVGADAWQGPFRVQGIDGAPGQDGADGADAGIIPLDLDGHLEQRGGTLAKVSGSDTWATGRARSQTPIFGPFEISFTVANAGSNILGMIGVSDEKNALTTDWTVIDHVYLFREVDLASQIEYRTDGSGGIFTGLQFSAGDKIVIRGRSNEFTVFINGTDSFTQAIPSTTAAWYVEIAMFGVGWQISDFRAVGIGGAVAQLDEISATHLSADTKQEIVAASVPGPVTPAEGAALITATGVTVKPSQGGFVILTADGLISGTPLASPSSVARCFAWFERRAVGGAWAQIGTERAIYVLGSIQYSNGAITESTTVSLKTNFSLIYTDTPPSDGDYDYRLVVDKDPPGASSSNRFANNFESVVLEANSVKVGA